MQDFLKAFNSKLWGFYTAGLICNDFFFFLLPLELSAVLVLFNSCTVLLKHLRREMNVSSNTPFLLMCRFLSDSATEGIRCSLKKT